MPDFPNFFMLNGPNGPVGNFSLIEVAELQFGYILQLVERIRSGACRQVSVTREALAEFEARPRGGGPPHGVGHGLSELVPRRPGAAGGVAVAVHPVPRAS